LLLLLLLLLLLGMRGKLDCGECADGYRNYAGE